MPTGAQMPTGADRRTEPGRPAEPGRRTRPDLRKRARLLVNPVACSAHGNCAELLPELITLDEWGYPVVAGAPVPPALTRQARRAVRDCPALALLLVTEQERP